MIRHLKFPKLRRKFSINNSGRFYAPQSAYSIFTTSPETGYYVLLPEVPKGALVTSDTNEVLNDTVVPSTFNIGEKKFRDAIGYLSLRFESRIWSMDDLLTDSNYSIQENLMKDLDTKEIDYAISLLTIVHLIHTLPHYESYLQRAQKASNEKYKSKPIYYAVKELLADNPRNSKLKQHVIMGKLNGLELTPDAQAHMERLHNILTEKKLKFNENVVHDNKLFRHLVVEEKHLGSMPVNEMAEIAKDKANPKRGPWTVTLSKKVYNSFLENCPVPALRWNLWQAYNQRGLRNDLSRNGIIIEEIRTHRLAVAKLLGYRNHAEFILESKMAANSQNVKSMIGTLLIKCMPQQMQEFERLHSFAASRGYDTKLNQWDVPFWRKKEREELYNVQNLAFPFPQTFKSLLSFTSRLFGFEYKEVSENHYIIKRSGDEIGRFVIDPYKSKSKFPGSYVIRNHLFSTLILNFDPPLYGNDSVLSPADLADLVENFGHLLQNCLCPREEVVVQDFKVPGHFLAMWLGNKQFMENFLGLKDDKLTNYLQARNHFIATDMCYELFLADLDLEMDLSDVYWRDMITKRLWKTYNVVDVDKTMFLCSSNLIHYGSTYYSELWSKMLAADCYRAFVESTEPKDVAVDGARFRTTFFEAPPQSQPSEIFRSFRGRDPSPDALLWTLGLMKLDKLDK